MPQTVFPCITFRDAAASIDFLERALGAERVAVHADDEGRINHAEIRIGESVVMCGDERAGSKATPPGVSVVYVVVPDADAAYERARSAAPRSPSRSTRTTARATSRSPTSTATAGRSAPTRARAGRRDRSRERARPLQRAWT